jgi:hypothetical protein
MAWISSSLVRKSPYQWLPNVTSKPPKPIPGILSSVPGKLSTIPGYPKKWTTSRRNHWTTSSEWVDNFDWNSWPTCPGKRNYGAVARLLLFAVVSYHFFKMGQNTHPVFMKIRARWAARFSVFSENWIYWAGMVLMMLPIAIFIADRIVDYLRRNP